MGRQPTGSEGRVARRRLGVRGGHKQERGGGTAWRRNRVSSGSDGVEGLPDGGAGVRGLWRRNDPVLKSPLSYTITLGSGAYGKYFNTLGMLGVSFKTQKTKSSLDWCCQLIKQCNQINRTLTQ